MNTKNTVVFSTVVKAVKKFHKGAKWTEFKFSIHTANYKIIIIQFLVVDDLGILNYNL